MSKYLVVALFSAAFCIIPSVGVAEELATSEEIIKSMMPESTTTLSRPTREIDRRVKVQVTTLRERLISRLQEEHAKGNYLEITEDDIKQFSEYELAKIMAMDFPEEGAEIRNPGQSDQKPATDVPMDDESMLAKFAKYKELVAAGVIGSIGFGVAGKKISDMLLDKKSLENLNDVRDERRLEESRDRVFRILKLDHGIDEYENPEMTKKANEMMRRLTSVVPMEEGEPEIRWRLIDSNFGKTSCTAANDVLIDKGLYDRCQGGICQTDDETAAVLAHEVAHGVKQHVCKMASAELYGDVELRKDMSCVFETDADSLGFQIAAKAGYNPGGQAAFLNSLKEREDAAYELTMRMGNRPDHPSGTVRYERALERLSKYSNNRVEVDGGDVYLDGDRVFSGSEHDACLRAGELARDCHENIR